MTKTFYFTAIVVCAPIFQPCNAMEPKAQHPILQIIKSIEEPSCGHFISPEKVIISHKKGVSIHHLPTNTVLRKISDVPSPHLALHPNKKLCVWFSEDKLRIYDTKEGILQYEAGSIPITASVFDPLNEDIIVLLHHDDHPCITRLNYKTKFWIDKALPRSVIAFHPTEKVMCRAENNGILSIHDSNCLQVLDNHPATRQTHSPRRHKFCQFSPDGSLLMEGDERGFRIRHNKKDILRPCSVGNVNIHEIIFHPNGQFVITLSQPNNKISYYDLINVPPNPTISMSCSSSEDNPPTAHRHMRTYLSCDENGENLLVILSKQCLIVPIPFEVIYQPQAKEECILAYFALQAHLPKDVRQVFIRKLLTLCKR